MNHLAGGGHLYKSCKAIFRTTPINMGISFEMITYPRANESKPGFPPVKSYEHLFARLPKGNIRMEAGITKAARLVDSTYII